MTKIDLHVHTTASDGTCTPQEIVMQALQSDIIAIAITDHDTISGLAEAEEMAKGHDIEIIRGCELSTSNNNSEIHVLALWVPREGEHLKSLEDALDIFQDRRHKRNLSMLNKLINLGIPIKPEDFSQQKGLSLGRPHFAKKLVSLGVVNSEQEAFRQYLSVGKKAYVPKDTLSTEDAVKILSSIGATVVLAHPALIHCTPRELIELIEKIIPLGLDALEVYHSAHTDAEVREFVDITHRYKLLESGGSDFHCLDGHGGMQLGKGKGNLRIPPSILDALKKNRMDKGLPL